MEHVPVFAFFKDDGFRVPDLDVRVDVEGDAGVAESHAERPILARRILARMVGEPAAPLEPFENPPMDEQKRGSRHVDLLDSRIVEDGIVGAVLSEADDGRAEDGADVGVEPFDPETQSPDDGPRLDVGGGEEPRDRGLIPSHVGVDHEEPVGVFEGKELLDEPVASPVETHRTTFDGLDRADPRLG